MTTNHLEVGKFYTKSDLSDIFDNPNIKLVREGIYNQSNDLTFYFVDLVKEGKEERFHFNDFFEEDFFHWDSQTTQHINSPKIKEVISGQRIPHLFVRVFPKVKSKTQPYIYCGRLKYIDHDPNTSNPVHIIFQNIDYVDDTSNEELFEIYTWKPHKIGKSSVVKQSKIGVISPQRKSSFRKPNKTERSGLVTSRVGQGYYRQLVREKWDNRCPVTGTSIIGILISSHIVPWSESSDDERLDVENGLLLSPNVDSLFDKHLISFSDDGQMLLSNKITLDDLIKLGINHQTIIPISEGMKKYLERHRARMDAKI